MSGNWKDFSMNFNMKLNDEFVEGLKGKTDLLTNGGVFFRETERKHEQEFLAIVIHGNNTPAISHGYIQLDDYKNDKELIAYAEEENMTPEELIEKGAFCASWILENNCEIIFLNEDTTKNVENFLDEVGVTAMVEPKKNISKGMIL